MPNDSEQIFKYRFLTKHKGLLWALAFFVPTLGASVYGVALNHGQTLLSLIIVWSITTPLILLAIWKERADRVDLNEVKVSEDGIWAQLRKYHLEILPTKNVQFIQWSSIDCYEIFSPPDTDDFDMFGMDGIRLRIKKLDRKISIYKHIENYELILNLIKRELPPV